MGFLKTITLNAEPNYLAPVMGAGQLSRDDSSVSISFVNSYPAVIHVSGFARATYNNPSAVQFAAVEAGIFIDGAQCSSTLSVEAQTGNVTFSSSASCITIVPPGNHVIEVRDVRAAGLPAMTNRFARVQYDALPAPGIGVFTPVIAVENVGADGASVEKTFTVNFPVIARIGGYVRASYNAGGGNAGIIANIEIDGNRCGSSVSFEGTTSSLTFSASPTCVEVLAPGTHTIRMRDANSGSFPGVSGQRAQLQFSLSAASNVGGYKPMGYAKSVVANADYTSLPYSSSGLSVVHIVGDVSSFANPGATRGAAAQAMVIIDGIECSSYLNLEGTTYTGGFNANASCIAVLPPGDHTISVRNPNYPGVNMSGFVTRLKYVSYAL